MPKRKPRKPPLREVSQPINVLQNNKNRSNSIEEKVLANSSCDNNADEICAPKSILGDENIQPITSSKISEEDAVVVLDELTNKDTAALYDELDIFRQRWKRELEEPKQDSLICNKLISEKIEESERFKVEGNEAKNDQTESSKLDSQSNETYDKAKKLFLSAVELEEDKRNYEAIRYYKQAMHLCPDIEKRIFREQCEASALVSATEEKQQSGVKTIDTNEGIKVRSDCPEVSLYDRIRESFYAENQDLNYTYCRPSNHSKTGKVHISDLPRELTLLIFRYIIGEQLDLAALEAVGLVCRGFYLLSKDPSLWKNICYATWGTDIQKGLREASKESENQDQIWVSPIDWRQMFLERPRVNYDGVYISMTRYIRQGDVGFQDITYRPLHDVRYYRYLRFFPDKRVLILTTNEEPEKIIPIFRHALHSRHFSPELSILEGHFEFLSSNQISIEAEKDCRISHPSVQSQRRGRAEFYWSRQTPISQKFILKFELKTVENKPYRNNVLKWSEYKILTLLETGQQITTFNLSFDTFPNLIFSRVKKFNLRLTNPLNSM